MTEKVRPVNQLTWAPNTMSLFSHRFQFKAQMTKNDAIKPMVSTGWRMGSDGKRVEAKITCVALTRFVRSGATFDPVFVQVVGERRRAVLGEG